MKKINIKKSRNPYQQIELKDRNNVDLMHWIQDDNLEASSYNVVINQVVAQKYKLRVGDVFTNNITNHIKQLISLQTKYSLYC